MSNEHIYSSGLLSNTVVLLWVTAQPCRSILTDCGLDSNQRCLQFPGLRLTAQTFRAALGVEKAWLFVSRNVTVGTPLCLSLEPLSLSPDAEIGQTVAMQELHSLSHLPHPEIYPIFKVSGYFIYCCLSQSLSLYARLSRTYGNSCDSVSEWYNYRNGSTFPANIAF